MNTRSMMCSFINPNKLIPTEEVDDESVAALETKIIKLGYWTSPIIVHKDALFVMDGHHRLAVAKRQLFKVMPMVLLDYDSVNVSAWREGEIITPHSIFAMARSGRKFPYKTTRHILRHPLPPCNVAVRDLIEQNAIIS
jgi:hypothetical protein